MGTKIGYSALKPIINPHNNVLKAIRDLDLPKGLSLIPIEKLHCTLMYDERNNKTTDDVEIPPEIYHANVMGVAVLGKAVVLLLSSDKIMKRHFELIEAGFSYSFDNYAPHMSILYVEGKDDEGMAQLERVRVQVQKLLTDKKLPSELYFTDEYWKPCD